MSEPVHTGGTLRPEDYGALKRAQRSISDAFAAEMLSRLDSQHLAWLCRAARLALEEVENRHKGFIAHGRG